MGHRSIISCLATVLVFTGVWDVHAQVVVFSRDELLEYTSLWTGDRFPDGRPKVPDDIIERMKNVSVEEAWGVLRRHGYNHQFDGGWQTTIKDPVLVGRVVTGVFMPLRPDVNNRINEKGKRDGRIGAQNSWIIDTLVEGDVLVIDLFGKIVDGTFAGDNLANSINARSGKGFIVDGGCRDLDGILEISDYPVFVRGWDPSYIKDVMLMGINCPIRIGRATAIPGDIVLGGREGVLFIPPHLAEEVVVTSEIVRLRDEFGHKRLREGKYTPGQIDTKWTEEIEKDFENWLKTDKGDEISDEERERLLKGRTW